MRRRWSFARLALGTLLGGGLLATHVPASNAECNWGIIYVTRKNASSIPVWGPGCIVPDDGTWGRIFGASDEIQNYDVPDGSPNGIFYEVIFTTP